MKKILSSVFIFTLLLTSTVSAAFRDVPDTHLNHQAISYLDDLGMIDSDLLFFPEKKISKPEFLRMAFAAAEYRDLSVLSPLEIIDVPEDQWYYDHIQKAIELRALFVGPERRIYPESSMSKVEGLRAALRIFQAGIPRFVPEGFSLPDVTSRVWFAPVVFRAAELGIAIPRDTSRFGPFDALTRAQAAEIIYRLRLTQLSRQSSYQDIDPSAFALSGGSEQTRVVFRERVPERYLLLDNVKKILEENYLNPEDVDIDTMIYGAIAGFVEKIGDPYTSFLSPEENQSFSVNLSNNLTGIGAYVSQEDGKIVIISPIAKSPAEKAGLKARDVILKIDGKETAGMSLTDAVLKIRGVEGTPIRLTISRRMTSSGLRDQILDFVIVRARVSINSVEWEMKPGRIAYISINQFTATSAKEFGKVASEIVTQSPRGIILDLRNNPGGFLNTAIDIASYFLPDRSLVAKTRDRFGNATNYTSNIKGELQKFKTVVLVNDGSASASEIVAGALQDYGIAKLIGQKTFGKGTAQLVQNFSDGSSLKFTIAKWFTPNDRNIHHTGIAPDVTTVPSDDPEIDNELIRAMLEF